jgi:hypothetical protein
MKIYGTMALPGVLYWCESRFLTLRDKHKLRIFENRLLGKLFGTRNEKVTGGWKKLIT